MLLLKTAWYWCALPVRLLLYFCSYIFGHPLVSSAVFALGTAAAFWDHRVQLASACIGILGLLLMWVAENPGSSNTAWPARSPFAPPLPTEA